MMKLTGGQIVEFCEKYRGLDDVDVENGRGMIAGEMYAALLPRALAYQLRQGTLRRERQALIKQHAVTDRRGAIQYGDAPGPKRSRPILWKDEARAQEAFDGWQEKADAFDATLIELALKPLPDDFFTKPHELDVVQGVRTGFLPLMAKYQAVHAAAKKAAAAAKRKRRK